MTSSSSASSLEIEPQPSVVGSCAMACSPITSTRTRNARKADVPLRHFIVKLPRPKCLAIYSGIGDKTKPGACDHREFLKTAAEYLADLRSHPCRRIGAGRGIEEVRSPGPCRRLAHERTWRARSG